MYGNGFLVAAGLWTSFKKGPRIVGDAFRRLRRYASHILFINIIIIRGSEFLLQFLCALKNCGQFRIILLLLIV